MGVIEQRHIGGSHPNLQPPTISETRGRLWQLTDPDDRSPGAPPFTAIQNPVIAHPT